MAQETNGNGLVNPSGVYRHPDTGEELVTQATERFGNPAGDAIVRLGFVYVGPADLKQAEQSGEKADLVAQEDPTASAPANTNPTTKTVEELEAELAQAKEQEAARQRALKDNSSLVKSESQQKQDAKATEKGAK